MYGPEITARSLSKAAVKDTHGNLWPYHSRSDRHSKIVSWGATLDCLIASPLLQSHIASGRVAFGINHEMVDFERDRKKNLDLVICTPGPKTASKSKSGAFADLVDQYGIVLSKNEQQALAALPPLPQMPVGSVLMAMEAKACMTAHQRALPRLYDELNSSHLTVHGASAQAIAVGLVMVNASSKFLSSDLNKANRASAPVWSAHTQPKATIITIDKVRQLPRRTRIDQAGFDAVGVTVVDCVNDGSKVSVIRSAPAPQTGDILYYASTIERVANLYGTRFSHI
jgi:hypothetical protein